MSANPSPENIPPLNEPWRLFSDDERKNVFLMGFWEPRLSSDTEALARLRALFEEAQKRCAERRWIGPWSRAFALEPKGFLEARGFGQFAHPLGKLFASKKFLMIEAPPERRAAAERFLSHARSFSFADERMKKEIADQLPQSAQLRSLKEQRSLLILPKKPGLARLSDLLVFRPQLDHLRFAWIASSLFNLACWLEWSGLRHGAISPETVWVDLGAHRAHLLDGWEHSGPLLSCASGLMSDPQMIKLLALGIFSGPVQDAIPPAGARFLNTLSPIDEPAHEIYGAWMSALETDCGPRRFHAAGFDAQDVYGISEC